MKRSSKSSYCVGLGITLLFWGCGVDRINLPEPPPDRFSQDRNPIDSNNEGTGGTDPNSGNTPPGENIDDEKLEDPKNPGSESEGNNSGEDLPLPSPLPPTENSDWPQINDWWASGYFQVKTTENVGPGRGFTLYEPIKSDPSFTEPSPVIFWANATSTPVGAYKDLLSQLASHGFVVLAGDDSSTGKGDQLIEGLDWVMTEPKEIETEIDTKKIGALGHSQGGASVVVVASHDKRLKAIVPIQPDCNFWVNCKSPEAITAPTLVLVGSSDVLVPAKTAKDKVYSKLTTTGMLATMEGADHTSWMREASSKLGGPVLAWLRIHLMADGKAYNDLVGDDCTLCQDSWTFEANGL